MTVSKETGEFLKRVAELYQEYATAEALASSEAQELPDWIATNRRLLNVARLIENAYYIEVFSIDAVTVFLPTGPLSFTGKDGAALVQALHLEGIITDALFDDLVEERTAEAEKAANAAAAQAETLADLEQQTTQLAAEDETQA